MEKDSLFTDMKPAKALAKMALPTVGSQIVILIYNLADTWFIGRTNDPNMIGASSLALTVYLAALCAVLFFFFADSIVGVFIEEKETVRLGAQFLRGRCFSMPFMMIGCHAVNYMNAVDKGKVSFLLAIIRHVVLIIPIMLIMNAVWSLDGLVWSQLVADAANSIVAYLVFRKVNKEICISS